MMLNRNARWAFFLVDFENLACREKANNELNTLYSQKNMICLKAQKTSKPMALDLSFLRYYLFFKKKRERHR